MELHHTSGKPDWAEVARRDYNGWQRLAAATNGVITPGNILTLIGFGLVVFGVVAVHGHHYWWAVMSLGVGRLFDIADGWAAQTTGTKSPLGEAFDATIDKIGTFLTLLIIGLSGIAPAWALWVMVLPYIVLTLFTLWAVSRGRRSHPSRVGKLSMAAAWVSLVGYVLAAALKVSDMSLLVIIVDGLAVATGVGAVIALFGYQAERD